MKGTAMKFAAVLLLALAGCASNPEGLPNRYDDEFERCAQRCLPTTSNAHDAWVLCMQHCEIELQRRERGSLGL
jgi:hypothetical protein